MGTYIAQSDVENVWGSVNVAAWSDLTGGRTADTTRIAAAIAYSESFVENRFRRSRYAIPFGAASSGGYDATLKDWMATFAGVWLYNSRRIDQKAKADPAVMEKREMAERDMRQVLAGEWEIDATAKRSDAPTAMSPVW